MKSLILTFLFLVSLVFAREVAAQDNWETNEICSPCMPRVMWFTDSINGTLYAPIQGSVSTVYRTTTGGTSWTQDAEEGYLLYPYDLLRSVSFLDASTWFWRTNLDLYTSTDSGRSWDNVHMFPVPKFLRMASVEKGLGVTATKNQDKQYEIQPIQTTDGGAYWDKIEGASLYTSKTELRDALFLDDSTFLFLHASPSNLIRTTDHGKNWNTVYQLSILDSVYMWRMHTVPNTDIVFIESYKNSPLSISFDRGTTWSRLPKTEGFHNYRTRAMVMPNQPMHLWAAVGDSLGNPSDDLLNPEFDHDYAIRLMHSTDTGKSWQEVEIAGFTPGAKIVNIIPAGTKLRVAFYKDSVTYLSSLELGDPALVETRGRVQSQRLVAYPNPVNRSASIRVSPPDGEYNRIEIRDALSNLLLERAVEAVRGELIVNLEQDIASGFYTITFFRDTQRVGSTSFIIR
jgi:hypothetical protein